MSAFLTWPEAKQEAAAGKLVRREAWPLPGSDRAWLRKRAVLWETLDKNLASLGIVEAGEFTSAEFFAKDWTTDEIGAARDVCQRPAPRVLFAPPGLRLTGELAGELTLSLDLGDSAPSGAYWVDFVVNGSPVGTLEAPTPGRYSLTTAPVAGDLYCEAHVRSASPLPAWNGVAVWRYTAPALDYFDITLIDHFPTRFGWANQFYGYPDLVYNGLVAPNGKNFGPYDSDRYIYSPAADPARADDILYIDGIQIGRTLPEWLTLGWNGPLGPAGTTALIKFLPAGQAFNVNVFDFGGSQAADGILRLTNRIL